MRVDALLGRQSDCIQCPDPAPCTCAANQQCFRINRLGLLCSLYLLCSLTLLSRDCYTCSQTKCVATQGSNSKPSSGVSKGALAGGIVGALLFLAIAIFLFFRFRRTTRLRKALVSGRETKKDIPAPAETVLNRPDPMEKPTPLSDHDNVRIYSATSNATVDVGPEAHSSAPRPPYTYAHQAGPANPFDDTNSIQTAGSEGTNVIPIAFVPADSHRSPRSDAQTLPLATSTHPIRPARSPDLNLNLDHVNVSNDNLRTVNPYATSMRSGISGISRNSYMSNASYSSDFLNEAPMIMMPTKGAVRQVLGVVKAEVINAGSISPNPPSDNLKVPTSTFVTRPSVGSPLASTSFGPADVLKESDESLEANDPFSDRHSSLITQHSASPSPTTTFGQTPFVPDRESFSPDWAPSDPNLPWAQSEDPSRPSSMSTQAGSVINISSATRVNVGLRTLGSGATSRSPFRTTMGRLISPSSPAASGTLQEQQQRALAHAQAQAQAQGLDKRRPISGSSAMSAASTRADSILESFPFVPPSPISDRPIRSPPVSPLADQSFVNGPNSPLAQHIFTAAPPSPLAHDMENGVTESSGSLPAPPNRRMLGLSTVSQFSTASSGLGSFPFQIDSGTSAESSNHPPSAFNGRQRASLDTLALTSDLSSYPLGFDQDSVSLPSQR
jgi:hypothetical protein